VQVGYPWSEGQPVPVLHRPVGCSACSQTGYRGRLALHEVMSMTEDISRLTVERASTDDIHRVALQQGMTELKNDGWLKVSQGRTSVEEVLRVVA
jgi:type IV pilus assembly protein PilB